MQRTSVAALVAVTGLMLMAHPVAALPPGYTTTEIPSGVYIYECDLNNQGYLAGFQSSYPNDDAAVIWSPDDGLTVLPGLIGESRAMQVNDLGQVRCSDDGGHCIWRPSTGRVAVNLPYNFSTNDLNNQGRLLCTQNGTGTSNTWVWDADTGLQQVTIHGSDRVFSWDFNNQGAIAGRYSGVTQKGGFRLDADGTLYEIDLPASQPDANYVGCYGINDSGTVMLEVGLDGGARLPGIWTPEAGYTLIDVPAGLSGLSAKQISNEGVVALNGTALVGPSLGYLWTEASGLVGLTPLVTDLPDDDYVIRQIYSVGDGGHVYCQRSRYNPATRQYTSSQRVVLTPVPEPATVGLVALGLSAMIVRRRRGASLRRWRAGRRSV